MDGENKTSKTLLNLYLNLPIFFADFTFIFGGKGCLLGQRQMQPNDLN